MKNSSRMKKADVVKLLADHYASAHNHRIVDDLTSLDATGPSFSTVSVTFVYVQAVLLYTQKRQFFTFYVLTYFTFILLSLLDKNFTQICSKITSMNSIGLPFTFIIAKYNRSIGASNRGRVTCGRRTFHSTTGCQRTLHLVGGRQQQ